MEEIQDKTAAIDMGMKLKLLRTERGKTAKDVSEQADLAQNTLSRIESGRFDTGIGLITKVAKVLDAHLELVKN